MLDSSFTLPLYPMMMSLLMPPMMTSALITKLISSEYTWEDMEAVPVWFKYSRFNKILSLAETLDDEHLISNFLLQGMRSGAMTRTRTRTQLRLVL